MRAIVAATALLLTTGCARDDQPLIERINAYRTSSQTCAGRPTAALGPLAPAPALAQVDAAASGQSLGDALGRAGYAAARAQAIVITGPKNPGSAMGVLKERYCKELSDAGFSEIGIAREGKTWRIVLAQPLISADLGGWRDAGREVLELVNEARATPRSCGAQPFGAAPPVEWSERLGAAALSHSRDMAERNYFAHAAPDGSTARERAERAGFEWQRVAENIATGQGSPKQVVSGWLASPGHCANVMQPDFTHMGTAYFVKIDGARTIYWTQVFAAPQR